MSFSIIFKYFSLSFASLSAAMGAPITTEDIIGACTVCIKCGAATLCIIVGAATLCTIEDCIGDT